LLWKLPFAPQNRAYNAATPIVDGQTVIYAGAGRGAWAVKIEKQGESFAARELWSNPDAAPQYNSPVLKDGLIFGFSQKGNLFCVNAQTGKTAWTDATSRDRSGFASIVNVGAVNLALPSSAELVVFKASDKQYDEVAKIKVAETSIYAYPVVSGKRFFIKDAETVTMWTLE
jgi:outer membrane protein assembly factor BamB